MNKDRFNDYDDELRQLVLDFERTVQKGKPKFFDVDELEAIIDYYMEVDDNKSLADAISFAEQLYPNSSTIKLRRAHWLVCTHQLDRAQTLLLQLEEAEPENTDVAYALGVLYGEMGNHERAIDYYLMATCDGWQSYRIHECIAEEYYKMQRYSDSYEHYVLSLSEAEFDTNAIYNMIDVAVMANKVEDAATFFDTFAHKHPYCKEAWYALGCMYGELKLFERGIEAIELAIAIDRNYDIAYIEKAHQLEDGGDIGSAATTLTHMLDFSSEPGNVYRELGQLYQRHNNFDTSMSYLRKAIDINPTDPDSLASMGMCLMRLGDYSMANTYAHRALAIDPENFDAMLCAALVSDHDEDGNENGSYFEKLLANGNNTESQQHCYTVYLFMKERYDDLIDFALQSLDLLPHDAFYSTHLAAAYFLTNRYNSLQQVLPDVNAEMLFQLCPQMWENPHLQPLLPPVE